jgi:hypothetical protein
MTGQLSLGAPGVYREPPVPVQTIGGVRMDVCGFAGVAPRGPARVPRPDGPPRDRPCVDPRRPRLRSVATAVESWDEYRRLYGSFEGPGLLPYAVASFFEQGGRRAYVVRIVHHFGGGRDAVGVARAPLQGVTRTGGGKVRLRARNEGAWGNALRARLTFQATPLRFEQASAGQLVLDAGVWLPQGALLRLTFAGGTRALRFVTQSWTRPRPDRVGRERVAVLEAPTAAPAIAAEMVEGTLDVQDTDRRFERRERHERLGLGAAHPRWLATVLCEESELLLPDPAWSELEIRPADATLPPAATAPFAKGRDRSATVTPEDFFDRAWLPGDEDPASGVQALAELEDLSMVVAADLYAPWSAAEVQRVVDDPSDAGPTFGPCVVPPPPVQVDPVPELEGLRLDPELAADRAVIIAYQQALVTFAEQVGSVALLDVPPRLDQRQILAWREAFASSFAAAYHPWLKVARPDDERDTLRRVNPSAVAAGIVARREATLGLPFGPANELAVGVIDIEDRVSPARHDELHPSGINVYLCERDGVRLSAARTLSRGRELRQLSVRRLMTMLRRVLEQETQWMVFEPHTASLRATIRHQLLSFLRQLYLAGAFQGTREDEAFFVRCDEILNPPYSVGLGRLVVEVGVAPVEPLEFLVLRLVRDRDELLRVEGGDG